MTFTRPGLRTSGLIAMSMAVLAFSVSSSLVKLSETPGSVIAFWRMIVTAFVWQGILLATGRRTTLTHLKIALVPGILFGLNLAMFFTAVTRTSIAHAEFLGSMTPLILIPAGALFFHERVQWTSMAWGLMAIAGIAVVLFTSPSTSDATLAGDLIVLGAMVLWASYLLTTKHVRQRMDVIEFMAAVTPIAAVSLIPVMAVRGGVGDMDGTSWAVVLALTFLTGTGAHGMIVFAQRSLPIATIGVMQIAQPALAVMWAAILLDETIRPLQIVGMAMVLSGLALFNWSSRRVPVSIDASDGASAEASVEVSDR